MVEHLNKDGSDDDFIIEIIQTWEGGKIQWTAFLNEIEKRLGKRPAKSTLSTRKNIMHEFQVAQQAYIAKPQKMKRSKTRTILEKENDKLRAEVKLLKKRVEALIELNVTYIQNAEMHGVTPLQLERKISMPNRRGY
ncbi:MAG: hypothetical protein HRT88_00100 [Lentisphaeraceae bacterium]|nr:hypothetical protein [Lentisphaeraceae bacterium]